ncbi:MAG TPA: four helix bundle protein [Bacteroidia bacterium]|jgi:four helix bundle protein|nr:four helix bundle protein [Bacteroidia bacterium]
MKHNYKNLAIWKESIDLTIEIYKASSPFPPEEKFGLTHQVRKAAVSVASNIAEGSGRNTNKDFANFLGMSIGSSCEVITQLIIAEKLGYIDPGVSKEIIDKMESIQHRTTSLQKSLQGD